MTDGKLESRVNFNPIRAFVFFAIGLPIGFIVVAFGVAVAQASISAAVILPWALLIAAGAGLIGGFRKAAQ